MANEAAWAARLARYKGPELKRSVWQLASAAALFGGAWALMYASLRVGYWLTLLLAVPAALSLIRLFIIHPDSWHSASSPSPSPPALVAPTPRATTPSPDPDWTEDDALERPTAEHLEHQCTA